MTSSTLADKLRLFTLTIASMAVISIAGAGISQPAMAQDDDDALEVLTINGKGFSINLVGSIVSNLPDNIKRQPLGAYYNNVIDDMIDTHLTAQAARESGLADNPLLREIAERAMDRVLAEAWLNEEINRRLTEDMVLKSYNDLVADTESRTEVRARHILVNSKDDAIAAIKRLDEGEDFAQLAIELSTGPSGPSGGELGYFRRGAMVPSFEVASFNLAKGEYTKEPIQTQFGWHVIYSEDRRVADAPSLDEAREQLINTISVKIAGSIIAELRSDADIQQMSFEDVRAAEKARQGNSE